MLVTMGMNGALAGPSSHFELSGVFDLTDLELCEVHCIVLGSQACPGLQLF